jgi:hypothetical protein
MPETQSPFELGYEAWSAAHKACCDADPMDRVRNGFDEEKYGLDANPFPKGSPERRQWQDG